MKKFLTDEIKKIKEQSLWREPAVLDNAKANRIVLNGREYLNFSSNDYLGYSTDPRVVEAAGRALAKYGAGGRSSRLVAGTLDLHAELEERLAQFKGTESALLFPTGFMTNLGVVASLMGPGDAVIMDRLNHASLIDAAKLSRARLFVYEHGSLAGLEKALARSKNYGKKLILTDSLFSMDGDFAPLKEIAALKERYGAWLMVDDAHATGIFGSRGSGWAEELGLIPNVDILIGTLSKALGSQGGFVCGSKELTDFLKNRARSFIYTTALAPAACGAALKSMELVAKEPERRRKLLGVSRRFRTILQERFPAHFRQNGSFQSQIVPFRLGGAEEAMAVSAELKERGIFVPAIRPPTVPRNECRLRFSITSGHTEADIDNVCELLAESLESRAVSG